MENISVQPEWCRSLPVQQQSVLFLGARGPDGAQKFHPCKTVVIAYRACVFIAAKYGRPLAWGEKADTFMSLDVFADEFQWNCAVNTFFDNNGDLPHHYLLHFYHGAEILGYKHPDGRYRKRWHDFYLRACEAMHINPETEEQMDKRLSDWERKHWG
jgi:hypothetical protein